MSDDSEPFFPEGTYRAIPIAESLIQSGADQSTAEQISVSLRVVDEMFPAVNGMQKRWFGTFTNQKSIDITLETLRIMGWDGVVRDPPYEWAGVGGNHVEIVVQHEEYAGKVRAKIKYVNKIGGMNPFAKKPALTDAGRAKLNARLRAHVGATNPRQVTSAPVARPPQAARDFAAGTTSNRQTVQTDEDRARAIDRGEDAHNTDDDDLAF